MMLFCDGGEHYIIFQRSPRVCPVRRFGDRNSDLNLRGLKIFESFRANKEDNQMQTSVHLHMDSAGECDCCLVLPEESGSQYGCEERKAVFTRREQEVLGRIREASLRAREIREELRTAGVDQTGDPGARLRALAELEELRRVRAELEKERIAAADERMRLLGHL